MRTLIRPGVIFLLTVAIALVAAGSMLSITGSPGRAAAQPTTDTDGDGIPDSEDACQADPEDLDAFQDEDGCAEHRLLYLVDLPLSVPDGADCSDELLSPPFSLVSDPANFGASGVVKLNWILTCEVAPSTPDSISISLLNQFDVVAITSQRISLRGGLTVGEQGALLQFVENGGALLLMGEAGLISVSRLGTFSPPMNNDLGQNSIAWPFGIGYSGNAAGSEYAINVANPSASPLTSGPFGLVNAVEGSGAGDIVNTGSAASCHISFVHCYAAVMNLDAIAAGAGGGVFLTDTNNFTYPPIPADTERFVLNTLALMGNLVQPPTPDEQLAAKHRPVLHMVNEDSSCDTDSDPDGDPYDPEAVEIVLANPGLTLQGPATPIIGPTAEDLFNNQAATNYLDFDGYHPDPQCIFFDAYAALRASYSPVTYVRVLEDGAGHVILQYWLFYYFNDWNNKHEGDWETVQLVFQADTVAEALNEQPWRVGYSQHGSGQDVTWIDEMVQKEGVRPKVFVAQGSHANYFLPVDHLGLGVNNEGIGCDKTWDEAQARRIDPIPLVLPDTVADSQDPLAWLQFQGSWGDTSALQGLTPLPWDGPKGPKHQSDGRWYDPMTWQNGLRTYSRPAANCYFPITATVHVGQGVVERLEDAYDVAVDAVRVRFQRLPVLGGGGSGSAAAAEAAGAGPVIMSLESPSGQVIDPSTVDPDVTYQVGTDYEYYDIENPEPGLWTVILDGTSLPAGGEDEAVTATFVPEEAPDGDVDGVADSLDNCPSTYNPAQTDSDGNGVGDACQAVGGIAELPEIAETPLDIPNQSDGNMSVLVSLAASSAAGLLTLSGAAWYARRRWLK